MISNLIEVVKNTEGKSDAASVQMNRIARNMLRKRGIFAI